MEDWIKTIIGRSVTHILWRKRVQMERKIYGSTINALRGRRRGGVRTSLSISWNSDKTKQNAAVVEPGTEWICAHCGSPNASGNNFCTHCGKPKVQNCEDDTQPDNEFVFNNLIISYHNDADGEELSVTDTVSNETWELIDGDRIFVRLSPESHLFTVRIGRRKYERTVELQDNVHTMMSVSRDGFVNRIEIKDI